MKPGLIDRTRARLATSPGRIVLAPSTPPSGVEAVSVAARDKWLVVRALVPEGGGLNMPTGIDGIRHDERLVTRYLDVWAACRRASGVTEAEARRELQDAQTMAVAMVLAGEADAVMAGPRDSSATTSEPKARGGGFPGSEIFLLKDKAIAVRPSGDPQPGPEKLARIALGALRLGEACFGREIGVQFVMETVTASLETRRRYQSEATAAATRVEEAIQTLVARAREARVQTSPTEGFPPLDAEAQLLVVSSGFGEDLGYRLEREYPGETLVGPLIQGALVPLLRVRVDDTAERVLDKLALVMLDAAGR